MAVYSLDENKILKKITKYEKNHVIPFVGDLSDDHRL